MLSLEFKQLFFLTRSLLSYRYLRYRRNIGFSPFFLNAVITLLLFLSIGGNPSTLPLTKAFILSLTCVFWFSFSGLLNRFVLPWYKGTNNFTEWLLTTTDDTRTLITAWILSGLFLESYKLVVLIICLFLLNVELVYILFLFVLSLLIFLLTSFIATILFSRDYNPKNIFIKVIVGFSTSFLIFLNYEASVYYIYFLFFYENQIFLPLTQFLFILLLILLIVVLVFYLPVLVKVYRYTADDLYDKE